MFFNGFNKYHHMDIPNQPPVPSFQNPNRGDNFPAGNYQPQRPPTAPNGGPINASNGAPMNAPNGAPPNGAPPNGAPNNGASEDDDPGLKCAKFFRTLLHLSLTNQNNHNAQKAASVHKLVQEVIGGRIQPEEFTFNLQQVLGSHAQPRLIPFLHVALPALRTALINNSVVIEGINLAEVFPHLNQGTSQAYPQASYMQSSSNQVQATIVQSNQVVQSNQIVQSNQMVQSSQIVQSNQVVQSNQYGETSYSHMKTDNGVLYQRINHSMPVPMDGKNGYYIKDGNGVEQADRYRLVPDNLPHMLLDPHAISSRLVEQMGGQCTSIDPEVFTKISEVVESRLRDLMAQLSSIVEHRIEPLRLNPLYTQINEPRKQLKFVEEVEKQAFTRRQNLEKEAWIKFSKSKTKDKDTVQKAKEIQRANQEENLNREANEAAIAALVGSRGQKRTIGQTDPSRNAISSVQNLQTHRPRVRRVIMKDFLCALNGKGVQRNSVVKFLVAYGLVEMPSQNTEFNEGGGALLLLVALLYTMVDLASPSTVLDLDEEIAFRYSWPLKVSQRLLQSGEKAVLHVSPSFCTAYNGVQMTWLLRLYDDFMMDVDGIDFNVDTRLVHIALYYKDGPARDIALTMGRVSIYDSDNNAVFTDLELEGLEYTKGSGWSPCASNHPQLQTLSDFVYKQVNKCLTISVELRLKLRWFEPFSYLSSPFSPNDELPQMCLQVISELKNGTLLIPDLEFFDSKLDRYALHRHKFIFACREVATRSLTDEVSVQNVFSSFYFDQVILEETESFEDYVDILVAANILHFPALKKECERFICQEVMLESADLSFVKKMLILAERYDLKILKMVAFGAVVDKVTNHDNVDVIRTELLHYAEQIHRGKDEDLNPKEEENEEFVESVVEQLEVLAKHIKKVSMQPAESFPQSGIGPVCTSPPPTKFSQERRSSLKNSRELMTSNTKETGRRRSVMFATPGSYNSDNVNSSTSSSCSTPSYRQVHHFEEKKDSEDKEDLVFNFEDLSDLEWTLT
ncbi:unnamed protein product [Bursaphelenchus okinawaensis]|uniref:TAFH domain-containing protein n=1 Tax=Bursaphelenchus okinawaensis TaxID=465554 RepID=A0A811JTK1_9BILA|nr:unnamed protein product [Bursaphelenchus okinawaensis]CAG9081854.1 unnamed protein product [Bursaphelenchus okinawaensis]